MSIAPSLKLLVIRSENVESVARFYTLLGFQFETHQHGSGPAHLAAEFDHQTSDGAIFEIYPATESNPATRSIRLGFAVKRMADVLDGVDSHGGKVLTRPYESPWGRRAVVADPEGRRIELYSVEES